MTKQDFENKIKEIFKDENCSINYINYCVENDSTSIDYCFDDAVISYSFLDKISKLTGSIDIFVLHETDRDGYNEWSIEFDFTPSDIETQTITTSQELYKND